MKRTSTAMIAALAVLGGAVASPAISATKAELVFWRSAQKSGDVDEYRAYLRQYPNGDFAELAKSRIAAAEAEEYQQIATANAPQIEDDLRLHWTERRDIQATLTRQGYDTNGVDGVFGGGTRSAIRSWQSAEGYTSTGYLNQAQADNLLERDSLADQSVETTTTTTASVDATQPVYISPTEARNTEAGLFLSNAEKQDIQRGLRSAGYYNGAIDGVFGSGTRGSIRDWQRAEGDAPTGYLTAAQARLLEVSGGVESNTTVAADTGGTASPSQADLNYEATLNRNARAEVEQRLQIAGFDPGKVNGKFGDTARDAIFNYRASRGLERHQYLDRNMVNLLVSETQAEFSQRVQTGQVDPEVAAAVAAGALLVGGAILLSD